MNRAVFFHCARSHSRCGVCMCAAVPTDCDQRDERYDSCFSSLAFIDVCFNDNLWFSLGWMGDAALSSDTFMYNFQSAAFFTNYIELVRDDQNSDGTIPDVVCYCARALA